METEAVRELIQRYMAAQGAGDRERLVELLDDDVRWTPPPSIGFGAPRGRDAVLKAMADIGDRYLDRSTMKVKTRWIVVEGDTAVVRQSADVVATNGKPYANEYVWVYRCRDGRIVEIEEHTDSLHFKEVVLSE